MDKTLLEAFNLLAEIVNKSGRAKPTSAENVWVSEIPIGVLRKAQQFLQAEATETEYHSDAFRHASAKTWDKK